VVSRPSRQGRAERDGLREPAAATVKHRIDGGDLAAANLAAPIPLGAYFVGPECRGAWRRRALQVENDPMSAVWITRAIIDADRGIAVGRAGFHGPPDADGAVEVGYAVDPAFRRRGYARAALVALLKWAQDDGSIRTVRASIGPDNIASRRVASAASR